MWQSDAVYISDGFFMLHNENYYIYLYAIYRVESRCMITKTKSITTKIHFQCKKCLFLSNNLQNTNNKNTNNLKKLKNHKSLFLITYKHKNAVNGTRRVSF